MSQAIPIFDFEGGIHPPENKTQSTQRPLQFAGFPKQLILPLHQHVGAAARPVINIGDRVLKGQLVAEAHGVLSVPIHAPTSGILVAIEDSHVPHASGLTDRCLIIEPDGADQWIEHQSLLAQHDTTTVETIDPVDIVSFIRDSGITGMGGAGFPTAVKLHGHEHLDKTHKHQRHDIDRLVLNAAECEPYITADDTLMRERAAEVIRGTQILLHILGAQECLIGIEDNKPEAIAALQAAVAEADEQARILVVVIPTKYPSGGEKQLIKILTGLEVPAGGIPANIGIVCQNVATAAAIARAVDFGEPLLSRITTVTGEAVKEPGNWEVLLGTPIQHLLKASGYQPQKVPRIIMGGPMMGFTLPNLDVPVIKTSNCLLAPSAKELPLNDMAMACIRCGQCAEACPSELLPQQLYWFSKSDEFDKAEQHNLFDCIECGACSYVCPSQIPLVQYYRYAKGAIREEQAATQKSEQARVRFEARIERQEREKAEKEAKRKARAEAAAAAKAAKAAAAEATGGATTTAKDTAAPALDLDKINKQIDSVKTVLAKSQEKLAAAKSAGEDQDKIAALETAVAKSTAKLEKLQQSVASSQPAAGQAGEDQALLQKKLLAQEERVNKAAERLDMAKAEQIDTGPALEKGLAKQQEKLQELKQSLASAKTAEGSPAKAAVVDIDKLNKQINSVKAVLVKSKEKLAAAKAANDDADKITALETAVTKSTAKLEKLQQSVADQAPVVSPMVATADDPQAQLQKKLLAQKDRVSKAAERLEMAKAEQLDTVPALEKGLAKQQEKLQQLQAQLETK